MDHVPIHLGTPIRMPDTISSPLGPFFANFLKAREICRQKTPQPETQSLCLHMFLPYLLESLEVHLMRLFGTVLARTSISPDHIPIQVLFPGSQLSVCA